MVRGRLGQLVARGGARAWMNSLVNACSQRQSWGRCKTTRRAEVAIRAGMLTRWRRMVPVVAVARPAMMAAVRVRLNAMTARMSLNPPMNMVSDSC